MSTHTPGPWVIAPYSTGTRQIQMAGRDVTIAIVNDDDNGANACLIAAAPDLLAAVETYVISHNQMYGRTSRGKCECPECDTARAAVAKARGGS